MEAILSSETSVLTRAIRRRIPEDGIPEVLVILDMSIMLFKTIS
jgi:hypothetical protein